ncbi:type II toxin-antitoxin system PemK/MazF family toxin [Microbacterium elymi]|uniref:Type II toxin-antitoxin system PemK/MazF family toxin n=1 Tax=Microbacterium elymi TaxID=2909587 RepID=A0ABY5NMS3_9MICO|nr:type II toxin-antitoxin system PemK/MazF family toxin [Microbacterium elymi]UUT36445.1 type II toxin-antitoxin system PemK/MazF family toxin [Microbacterium elymi]
MTDRALTPGTIAWAALDPIRGREQAGHRPVLVVSSLGHLAAATTLAIVLPVTSKDRGWPNHVVVTGPAGLDRPSWIMTEHPGTLSRERLTGIAGQVSAECLASARTWLGDFLDLWPTHPR